MDKELETIKLYAVQLLLFVPVTCMSPSLYSSSPAPPLCPSTPFPFSYTLLFPLLSINKTYVDFSGEMQLSLITLNSLVNVCFENSLQSFALELIPKLQDKIGMLKSWEMRKLRKKSKEWGQREAIKVRSKKKGREGDLIHAFTFVI